MEKFNYYQLSFVGRREENQDSSVALDLGNSCYFLAVADGMGGAAGGQVASQLVAKTAQQVLSNSFSTSVEPSNLKDILTEIYLEAQKVISVKIQSRKDLSGMGTTLTCVLIQKNKYIVGNLGDSRVYVLSKGTCHQITQDHSYLEDYKNKSGKEADLNIAEKYGHYLLKSLDGGEDTPDIFPKNEEYYELKPKDGFLLCSDGLLPNKSNSHEDMFYKTIMGTQKLQYAAETLIVNAFNEGSTDNITVALGEYGKFDRTNEKIKRVKYPPVEKKGKTISRKSLGIVASWCLLTVAVLLILFQKLLFKESKTDV
ncbi:hypothetical protein BVY01_02495, partial [bacterium I07]